MDARRTERALLVVLHLALVSVTAAGLGAALAAPCHAQEAGARGGSRGAARAPFSADERARLAKGELVTRPVEERRGALRLIGGNAWQYAPAARRVWRAMLETKYYPRMLPATSGASLVSNDEALGGCRSRTSWAHSGSATVSPSRSTLPVAT